MEEWLKRKDIKPKEKTAKLADGLLSGELTFDELIHFAASSKDTIKATCMEACEFVTVHKPELAAKEVLMFAQEQLTAKAPRLKWESAKVVGNIAHLFQNDLADAVRLLMELTKDDGTVVRWSAAYALAKIYTVPHYHNEVFRNRLQQVMAEEEKDSIKKIYAKALKT